MTDATDEMRPDDRAKSDLKALEDIANLPSSGSAKFMQLIGVLAILASVFALKESLLVALAGAVSGGFIVAAGHLQQAIFDVRTMMLRESVGRSSAAEQVDA